MSDPAPLRVLHVLGELRRSGAEMMLADSIGPLRDLGVETAVLATGAQVGEMAGAFEGLGVPVHHLPYAEKPGFLLALGELARGHDVVHVHTERASFWICGWLRLCRVPVVRTVHSAFPFEGRLRGVRSLQRKLLRWTGVLFVAIGREVADNERRRFGIAAEVVPNFVQQRFHDAQRSEPSDVGPPIVLTVGNCGEPKNHEACIRAVGLLHRQGFSVGYRHVGSESGAIHDERALAVNEAPGRCEFVGADDPLEHLRSASVFVMPSVREGFGLAALEALATGTPTLLADSPGLREFADVPGVWWAEPTPEGLAEGLREVLTMDARDREARACEAARHVREAFDGDMSRRRLVELYRRVAPARP